MPTNDPRPTTTDLPSLKRREELRRDLHHREAARRIYALETLLAQLWVKMGRERLMTACALFDYSPPGEKDEVPLVAHRLCAHLTARREDSRDVPAPPPTPAELTAWAWEGVSAVFGGALDSLNTIMHTPGEAANPAIRTEIEVCHTALKLAESFHIAELGDGCVRLLRQFTLHNLHASGPTARDVTLLRETACRVLGAITPDALFLLWYTLGSPDPQGRRDVLPVLDYVRDARAVPYLLRLLERRGQWPDGEMAGWFLVRALERIGDRRAIPVLWRVVEASRAETASRSTSVELGREAKRVIESLEGGQAKRDRERLLRPAVAPSTDLVRPVDEPPTEDISKLPRSADPTRDTLLRPLMPSAENLLRPALPTEAVEGKEGEELLRAADDATE